MDFLMMAKLIFSIERRLKTAWSQCYLWCCTNGSKPASVRFLHPWEAPLQEGVVPMDFLAKDLILWFFWSGYNSISSWSCHSMLVGPLRCHLTRCCWVSKLGCHSPRTSTAMACSCKNNASWNFGKLVAPSYVLMLWLAAKSLQEGQSLFGLVPKFHSMAHFKADIHDLLRQMRAGGEENFFCWIQQFLIALAMKTLWVELQNNLVG